MPTPTPTSFSREISLRSDSIEPTISSVTASRPADTGVAPAIFFNSLPSRLMAAARRFVPPRSTPIAYSPIRLHDSEVAAGGAWNDVNCEYRHGKSSLVSDRRWLDRTCGVLAG